MNLIQDEKEIAKEDIEKLKTEDNSAEKKEDLENVTSETIQSSLRFVWTLWLSKRK